MRIRADTIGIAVVIAMFIFGGMLQQWELANF